MKGREFNMAQTNRKNKQRNNQNQQKRQQNIKNYLERMKENA